VHGAIRRAVCLTWALASAQLACACACLPACTDASAPPSGPPCACPPWLSWRPAAAHTFPSRTSDQEWRQLSSQLQHPCVSQPRLSVRSNSPARSASVRPHVCLVPVSTSCSGSIFKLFLRSRAYPNYHRRSRSGTAAASRSPHRWLSRTACLRLILSRCEHEAFWKSIYVDRVTILEQALKLALGVRCTCRKFKGRLPVP